MLRGAIILLALGLSACYDSSFGERRDAPLPEPYNISLRDLCDDFLGSTITVTGDIVVRGRVTTSDRAGNFYHTLCIQSDGAGMELLAGFDHLWTVYPVGSLVTLHLRGLALGRHYGVVQAGLMPVSGKAVEALTSPAACAMHLRRESVALEPPEPLVCRIESLEARMAGTLVRIEGLRYAPEEVTDGTWSGYKRFEDTSGREVYTYVHPSARFAQSEVPAQRCALTGILQWDSYGEERRIIKLRDENDCAY